MDEPWVRGKLTQRPRVGRLGRLEIVNLFYKLDVFKQKSVEFIPFGAFIKVKKFFEQKGEGGRWGVFIDDVGVLGIIPDTGVGGL